MINFSSPFEALKSEFGTRFVAVWYLAKMKIYLSHSRGSFDFKSQFYEPCQKALGKHHILLMPHQSEQGLDVRQIMEGGQCDLVIAEVSHPSTGQGIELAWAEMNKIGILACFLKGKAPSTSLRSLCSEWLEYDRPADLVDKLSQISKLAGT